MKNLKTLICILSVMVLFLPFISTAQNDFRRSPDRKTMHHEVPGDAYLGNAHQNHETSAAYSYKSSLFFTTQVNVDASGNNITGDAANEPSMDIDPTNPDRMMMGWRQFDNVQSNFRQAGYGYSDDGGQTWTFPGKIEPGVFRSDPIIKTDSLGHFYYNSLTVDGNDNYTCDVYKTPLGSFTWSAGVDAQGGDKQWMNIDKSGGAGQGNIYSFWTSYYSICAPDHFTRSTNGGTSFEDCVSVDGDPYWGTMAVGPSGELYVAGSAQWDGLVVARSDNAQNAGSSIFWDNAVQVDIDGYVTGWTDINPSGLLGQVSVGVDCSGGPGNGYVYALASVERLSTNDPADVMFVRSTNGGLSWSTPIRINDDPGQNDYQWFGLLSVAPNGRIDVAWLDTRDDPTQHLWSALYYCYSLDQGLTWSANEKLSDSFNPHVGWPNQQKMGDYFDMISDNSSAHLAWCNTLNGEQDVYYGRITPQYVGIGDPPVAETQVSLTAYPNPVSNQTTLRYTLPSSGQVRLTLYDVCGKEIMTLVNEKQTAGTYSLNLDVTHLPGGMSYCRLVAGDHTKTISLAVLK
jgi:hypothetical protein